MKHVKKIFALLTIFALLLTGCVPAVAPEPGPVHPPEWPISPEDPAQPDTSSDPTVPSQSVDNAEITRLSATQMQQIENDWYTATGVSFGEWCEVDEEEFVDGVRYYGSYAGFQIIFRPTGDDAITELEVEDLTFAHNNGFEIYAYRDGTFTPLQEACEEGKLSVTELKELSLQHLAYETRAKRPMIPSVTPAITLDIQQGMKQAFLRQYVNDDRWTTEDLSIISYGEYNGAYVGFINGIFMYTQAFTSETVAGVTFRYNTGQKLLVYFEGELIGLQQAYDRGALTVEALETIRNTLNPMSQDNVFTE
jgi:hypothetical protein